MSNAVDRNKVFQTTRVRNSLKNDISWIQISNEQEVARTDQAVETKPVSVRLNSYVQSTAKKFESVDSPLSPPLQNTEFIPSEGDSANHANGEVISPHKDAQPEGSTVETTDDTKPQAPTEEPIQNGEAQPEKSVANTTAENKEENPDTAVDQSNVDHNEGAAEVSADVHLEEHTQKSKEQPASSTNENPEAVSPVEPAEQPIANTKAENKREYADTAVDQSNIAHNEVQVSADAHVEGPVAETGTAAGTAESKDSDEVPVVLVVKQRPQEEPSTKTEPENATNLEDAGVESTVQPAEGISEKCHPELAAEEIVEAVAEVGVESSLDKSAVTNATPGVEGTLQDTVEPVPDLLLESVSELPTQTETATEGSCEKGPPEPAARESVEVAAEVNVVSSPETPAVTDAVGEEAALQDSVEPVPDLVANAVSELPTQPAPETAVKTVECKVEYAASAEAVLQTRAEEVAECEVHPAYNSVVEQNVEPTPESAVAVEPVTASDAHRAIELTDALDVQPPAAEATPEPLKEPEQSHTKETKLSQQSDRTNMYGKAVCSFCDKIIDGHVKITFSEPLVTCHPDCLKCGECAKALGDLLTPMFLHNQVIQCDGCFAKALKI